MGSTELSSRYKFRGQQHMPTNGKTNRTSLEMRNTYVEIHKQGQDKGDTIQVNRKSHANMLLRPYDASNKGDPSDGKSQWGFVIFLFDGPISWGSKKHNHVGLSSTHNEYMALCQASKEVVWVRKLLKEVGYMKEDESPTPMIGDNAIVSTNSS